MSKRSSKKANCLPFPLQSDSPTMVPVGTPHIVGEKRQGRRRPPKPAGGFACVIFAATPRLVRFDSNQSSDRPTMVQIVPLLAFSTLSRRQLSCGCVDVRQSWSTIRIAMPNSAA